MTTSPSTGIVTVYPYEKLGHADHGWLDARHHFSFASYHNPQRMGFGNLLVINDDRIAPHQGFGIHPHRNMEIITYVREGAITHKDSLGNVGRTEAGDVQVMSAGTGIQHSEYNLENMDTRLYQIWITPHTLGVTPRWDAKQFPKTPVTHSLAVLASGMAEHTDQDALFIHQDAAIYGGKLAAGTTMPHNLKHQGYVLASFGNFLVNSVPMNAGDGAEITGTKTMTISALTDAEILVIDAPESL